MNWRHLGPAKIRNNGRHFYVFSDILYPELLVCYIQIFYIILKLNFLWVSASVLDETLVFNSWMGSPKCWKIMKFSKRYENFNFSKQNLSFLRNFKILKNDEIFETYENCNFQSKTFHFEKNSKFSKMMKFSKNMKILIFQSKTFP